MQYYYHTPLQPQGSVPPVIHFPIRPIDVTADIVPYGKDINRRTILNTHAEFINKANASFAAVLSSRPKVVTVLPVIQGTDAAPLRNNAKYLAIINSYYALIKTIPQPIINTPLTPQLIPNPENTIPIPFKSKFNLILPHWHIYKPLPVQHKSVVRLEHSAILSLTPAGRLIAFQTNAFQTGYPSTLTAFQGFNRAVKLADIKLNPLFTVHLFINEVNGVKRYKAGSCIILSCRVFDPTSTPARLIDPDTVAINITNPDDTPLLTLIQMPRVSEGNFKYVHQTLNTDQKGAYEVSFRANIGSNVDETIEAIGFVLV